MQTCRAVLMATLLLSGVRTSASEGVFEVKATSVNSIMYVDGKAKKSRGGDEVVYLVNLPEETVTRTALYNSSIKGSPLGGVQSDNSVYTIIHFGNDLSTGQDTIKAFGKAGLIDGYELIVIAEDFVTTSRSTGGYFILYYYNRTDSMAEQYRIEHGKGGSMVEGMSKWLRGLVSE